MAILLNLVKSCIAETWLGTDIDAACIGEMVRNGYDFHDVPRSNGRTGGGVGIVYKTGLSLKVTSSSASGADTSQFEYIDCCTDNNCATIRFVVVYRPPTSARNGLKNKPSTSFDHNNIIIVGDVNFHIDVDSNLDAGKFKDSLATCGYVQHVNEPTHQRGHTLDVVITKDLKDRPIIGKLEVTDPVLCDNAGNIYGDHYAISSDTNAETTSTPPHCKLSEVTRDRC